MMRTVSLSPVLLVASLSPLLLQTSITCDLSRNPNLRSLEVQAGGLDRIVDFEPGATHYDVWTNGSAEITVRARAIDLASTIRWSYGGDSGRLGTGYGDVTLSVVPGAELSVATRASGGATQTYTVSIDPPCDPGACDDADICTTDICNPMSRTCELYDESPCPVEGRLLGGPFTGVSWEALGTSVRRTGVLDDSSTFDYLPGQDVRFHVGQTVLGEVEGAPELDWFDILGMESVVGMSQVRLMLNDRSSQLHTLINVAVFLYTFDYDGDASNGVQIHPDTADWLDFFRIDVERDWMRFRHDIELRSALNDINAYDVLPQHRVVRNSAYAIQTLYDALGVDPQIYGPKRRDYTEGGGSPAHVQFFAYDDWGNRKSWLILFPGPDPDHRAYGGVNDNGNKTTWWEAPEPGIPDLHRHEYDLDGNLVHRATDLDANAIVDLDAYYQYDAYGRRLVESSEGNGPSGVTTWAYDDDGNVVREEENGFVRHMEYDPNGYLVRALEDANGDDTFDTEQLYEYDYRGNLVGSRSYQPIGALKDDIAFEYTYDAQGNLIAFSEVRNGVHFETRSWTYDDDGNAVTMTSTLGEDRTLGPTFTSTYERTGWVEALEPLPRTGPHGYTRSLDP
jgi:YD repeat-containing protein